MDVLDLDGDGDLEIVVTGEQLYIYDAATGTQEYKGGGGGELQRIADVDNDGVLEIVSATWRGALRIFDGATYAEQLVTADLDITLPRRGRP